MKNLNYVFHLSENELKIKTHPNEEDEFRHRHQNDENAMRNIL